MDLVWKLILYGSIVGSLFLVVILIKNNNKRKNTSIEDSKKIIQKYTGEAEIILQEDDYTVEPFKEDEESFELYYNNISLEESFDRLKKHTLILNNGLFVVKDYKTQWILPSAMESKLLQDFNYVKSVYNKVLNIDCTEVYSEIEASHDDLYYQKHLKYYRDKFYSDKEVYLKYIRDRKDKIFKAYDKVKLGRIGEERVWDTIKSFDNCLCLKNKRLEYVENTNVQGIQMDSIIISSKGLFVLEVKNLSPKGEYNVHIDKTGVWRAIYPNGKEFVMDENANKQNNRHITTLNKIINKSLGTSDHRYIEAKGITVIANNIVKVDNNSTHQIVLCIDEIYNYINSFDIKYTDEQKQFLYEFIEKNNKPEKPIKNDNLIYEFKEVSSMILEDLNNTRNNIKKIILS